MNFTDDYILSSKKNIRNPKAFVEIYWSDPDQDTNVEILSNDINRVNRTYQVIRKSEHSGRKWAYLGEELRPNGLFYPMSSIDSEPIVGWYGSNLYSGFNGFFNSGEPYLSIKSDYRPLSSITVIGDSFYNEYPVDFSITFHRLKFSGEIIIDDIPIVKNYYGNNSRIFKDYFETIKNVYSITLKISRWSKENTTAKIISFYGDYVERFNDDEITYFSILEEINSENGSIPISNISSNELEIGLLNDNRKFSYQNNNSVYHNVMIPGRKIKVFIGFVLPNGSSDLSNDVDGYIVETISGEKIGYMPYGVFWSRDFNSSFKENELIISAYDITSYLYKQIFKKSVIYSGLLKDIINQIMKDAYSETKMLNWDISSDIDLIETDFLFFEEKSYLDVLKELSKNFMFFCYSDRNGILSIGNKLYEKESTILEQIYDSDYFDFQNTSNVDEIINEVTLSYFDYSLIENEFIYDNEEIFILNNEIVRYNLKWNNQPVEVSSVSIEIISLSGSPFLLEKEITSVNCSLTIKGNIGDSFSLNIIGSYYKRYTEKEVLKQDEISILKYGKMEFSDDSNYFISSLEKANDLAQMIVDQYKESRNYARISWPGFMHLSIGDLVKVTEFNYDGIVLDGNFLIKRQNISFDGSIRVETELIRKR